MRKAPLENIEITALTPEQRSGSVHGTGHQSAERVPAVVVLQTLHDGVIAPVHQVDKSLFERKEKRLLAAHAQQRGHDIFGGHHIPPRVSLHSVSGKEGTSRRQGSRSASRVQPQQRAHDAYAQKTSARRVVGVHGVADRVDERSKLATVGDDFVHENAQFVVFHRGQRRGVKKRSRRNGVGKLVQGFRGEHSVELVVGVGPQTVLKQGDAQTRPVQRSGMHLRFHGRTEPLRRLCHVEHGGRRFGGSRLPATLGGNRGQKLRMRRKQVS